MGTYSILVIGSDWRSAIGPSIDFETNSHIKYEDKLKEAINKFKRERPKVKKHKVFLDWLIQIYRLPVITHDRYPDGGSPSYYDFDTIEKTCAAGKYTSVISYRYGWIRLDEEGEIAEVIVRDAAESTLRGKLNQFPLKPGCKGWDADPYWPDDSDPEVLEGFVSSARVCDIDWDLIREPNDKNTFSIDYIDIYKNGLRIGRRGEVSDQAFIDSIGDQERITLLVVHH